MHVELLTVPGCAGCDRAKRMLEKLQIEFRIIDITVDPSHIAKHQLYAAPGIVIDGKLAFSGVPKEEDLLERLAGSHA